MENLKVLEGDGPPYFSTTYGSTYMGEVLKGNDQNGCIEIAWSKKAKMPLPESEPGTLSVWDSRDNHYTTDNSAVMCECKGIDTVRGMRYCTCDTLCSDFRLVTNHQLRTKITTIIFICLHEHMASKHDLQFLYQRNSVFLPEIIVCLLHHVYGVLLALVVELHPSSFV